MKLLRKLLGLYRADELARKPTLDSRSHFELKLDNGRTRFWLAHDPQNALGVDGMVLVEKLLAGHWIKIAEYIG